METGNSMPGEKGHERILLIDDEVQITEMAKRLLESSGYYVDVETSSITALEKFRQRPDLYDLVITDMRMPRMKGDRLSLEILGIRPDIPIILCTGYSEEIDSKRAKAMGIGAFILKPVGRQKLTATIRELLDRKAGQNQDPAQWKSASEAAVAVHS